MIPLLAIILGLLIGLFATVSLPNVVYSYIALAILCTIDSLIGAARARVARRYSSMIFVTGWLGNLVLALVMNAIGDALGVDLALPVTILLGMRIFSNVAKLRRIWLKNLQKRQRTIRVWMEKTGQSAEDLPLEEASGEQTERQKKVDDLRSRARMLRLQADSLLSEADVLFEQEAMAQLAKIRQEEASDGDEPEGQADFTSSFDTSDVSEVEVGEEGSRVDSRVDREIQAVSQGIGQAASPTSGHAASQTASQAVKPVGTPPSTSEISAEDEP